MSIKLVCFEPWKGLGITQYDSGFGDRIKYWVLAYQLSLIIEDIQIIVEEKYWPELLLLDLPNTKTENITRRSCRNKLISIGWEEVKNIMLTGNSTVLDSSNDVYYYLDFSLEDFVNIFEGQNVTNNFIMHKAVSEIKLKLPIVSDFMQQEFSDCCCIHLRRGHGTFPTLKFLQEMEQFLSKERVNFYWRNFHRSRLGDSVHSKTYKYYDSLIERDTDIKEKNLSSNQLIYDYKWVNNYKIVLDSDYFNLIQNFILKEKYDEKIYISSDIPRAYYSYYYNNFSSNIMDEDVYFLKFSNLHKGQIPTEQLEKRYSIPISKVFKNVFDLMVGCYSKTIVRSTSNWSKISSLYKRKKVIHADRITSTNSLGNWIFMNGEIDFIDDSLYNGKSSLI
jgi:hypothetical protein